MGKNILVISSSPRRGGNSDILCDRFMEGAKEAGHAAEKIFLKDEKINYCCGCGACYDKKACAQKDSMAAIIDKMISVDVIVMATPIYFYTMCGQMKTFIDRLCSGYTKIRNKEFYFILAMADGNKKMMETTMAEFRSLTGLIDGADEKGVIYGVNAWAIGDVKKTPAFNEAYTMGKKV